MSMMKFDKQIEFRYSELDVYNHVLPQSLLTFFQDIAGEHASNLGVGYQPMIDKDLICVIVRSKYTLYENPIVDKKYILSTWPQPKGNIDFVRDYLISDEDGNIIAKGTSKWCVTNFKTRRLVRAREVNFNNEEYYPIKNYDEPLTSLDLPDEIDNVDPVLTHKVSFTDLDHNHQKNNTKYATLIMDAICPKDNELVNEIQINYIKECHLNDIINIYMIHSENNKYLFRGKCNDKIIFEALVTTR